VSGPFGWITSGQVDVDFHLFIPQLSDGHLMKLLRDEISEIKEAAIDRLEDILQDPGTIQRLEESISDTPVLISSSTTSTPTIDLDNDYRVSGKSQHNSGASHILSSPAYRNATKPTRSNYQRAFSSDSISGALGGTSASSPPRVMEFEKHYLRARHSFPVIVPPAPDLGVPPSVFMRWSVTLNDLRASVPVDTADISYLNKAMIRPIVAYMNAHRSTIPLAFEGSMPLVSLYFINFFFLSRIPSHILFVRQTLMALGHSTAQAL
jgi:distribution and morphology protein 31